MSAKPSSLRNMGPATDAFFARAGIHTAKELIELGPDEAYFRALRVGGQAHFIGYYAIVMGLQGRPWNDCRGKEKDALKARFEAIKARLSPGDKNHSELERALDKLGVIERKV